VAITIDMIKELRAVTGVGMNKCKEALKESDGNIEEAVSYLRKKGMASAVKKEGREAREGAIVTAESNEAVSIVEVNAETDFAVNNDIFKTFAANVAQDAVASRTSDAEAFLKQPYSQDASMNIDEYRASVIAAIGENIQIKRLSSFDKKPETSIGVYSHMNGKIVSLVEIVGSDSAVDLARDIAMHIAAEAPEFLSEDDVPEETKDKEKEIARSQVEGKKPDHIIGKIIEGKLNAYFNNFCLLHQKYIKDSDLTVAQLLEKVGKEQGKTLSISHFVRWKVGGK
jgi:elongation factor Ts